MRRTLFTLVVLYLTGCSPSPFAKIALDGTELCFSSEYSPETFWMDLYLAPIRGQLDSSEGQVLIFIPSGVIKSLVPAYTVSHINSHGVDFKHDLRGIAYAQSIVSIPGGMAADAWKIDPLDESIYIEEDPDFPFFRIYPYREPTFTWHLAKTPPNTDASGPPADWYVGYCLEAAGSYRCRQTVMYGDVYYEYDLQAQDLNLRIEVQEAVRHLLEKWERNCEGS